MYSDNSISIVNRLMNKEVYLMAKFSIQYIGKILINDFAQIEKQNKKKNINSFMSHMFNLINREFNFFLPRHSTFDYLKANLILDNHNEELEMQNNALFIIDGINNFVNSINIFCIVSLIIRDKKVSSFFIHLPMHEEIIWFAPEIGIVKNKFFLCEKQSFTKIDAINSWKNVRNLGLHRCFPEDWTNNIKNTWSLNCLFYDIAMCLKGQFDCVLCNESKIPKIYLDILLLLQENSILNITKDRKNKDIMIISRSFDYTNSY